MDVTVFGPKDRRSDLAGRLVVDVTSRSDEAWSRSFSPFLLGPVEVEPGVVSATMENAWQYSKVYAERADADGEATEAHRAWAAGGFASPRARRHPQGRGARPLHALWRGRRLGYADARREIYWPLYRDAVRAGARLDLLRRVAEERPIALFDFDGYADATVARALADLSRPMGHAFVLKAMLEHGDGVTPGEAETRVPA